MAPARVKNISIPSKDRWFMIATAFAAALTIGIAFYWIQLFFFKKRFTELLSKAIPGHQDILYNTGSIKRINADKLLTFDDLKTEDFYQANGKIGLHWENAPVQNHIIQPEVPQGLIEIPTFKEERETPYSQSPYLKELYIDLKTGVVNHFSNLGSSSVDEEHNGVMLKEQTLIVGQNWKNVFPGLKKMESGQILPLTPWKIKILDRSALEVPLLFSDSITVENVEKLTLN